MLLWDWDWIISYIDNFAWICICGMRSTSGHNIMSNYNNTSGFWQLAVRTQRNHFFGQEMFCAYFHLKEPSLVTPPPPSPSFFFLHFLLSKFIIIIIIFLNLKNLFDNQNQIEKKNWFQISIYKGNWKQLFTYFQFLK